MAPAADACGVAGTAEAARRAAGSLVASGRAEAARVEQAAIVVGSTLTYDYCPTGPASPPPPRRAPAMPPARCPRHWAPCAARPG